jgi:dihydroxycyclohexadiene carboxylate dehydrogenase
MNSASQGRFTGRVVIVTGAAQGVGLACAERIGREGGRIVLADMAAEPTREAARALAAHGIETLPFVGDLSQPDRCHALMRQATEHFGRVDAVINNIGGTLLKKPFWCYETEEIAAEVLRSFWPMLWTAHAAIRVFRTQQSGVLVNIGSNAVDGQYRVPYSACKGAVEALTTALATETSCFGVRVNCVALGGTVAPERKTPRLARSLSAQEQQWEQQFLKLIEGEDLLGRFATAEEQAAVVAFVASDDAAHVTGEVIRTGRRGRRLSDYLEEIP